MESNNGHAQQLTRVQIEALDIAKDLSPQLARAVESEYKVRLNGAAEQVVEIRPEQVPSLPEWAAPPRGLDHQAGRWLDIYTDYALSVSPMTPLIFHESAALWLASVAIARRLVLPMPYGDVFPNLFIIWLAPTTLYRKTTALTVARKASRKAFPELMAPQDTTTEAFLSDMAGYQPQNLGSMALTQQQEWEKTRNFAAQKGLVYDEMSGLMAGAGKDYNAGLLEAFLRFYDCESYFDRSTRSQGLVMIKNAYLSILGSSTPAAMSMHFKAERLWGLGWWPRFAVLTPESRPNWAEASQKPEPAELAGKLTELYNRLPTAKYPEFPNPITVTLGTGVFEAWQKYNKALSYDLLTPDLNPWLYGTYGRLPTQALKVATILAALDWQPYEASPRIELPQLARALAIVETWRASAHRALEVTTASESDRIRERITRQLSKHDPHALSLRDLSKLLSDIDKISLEMALQDMVNLGDVLEADAGAGAKGGRPTKRYVLCKE